MDFETGYLITELTESSMIRQSKRVMQNNNWDLDGALLYAAGEEVTYIEKFYKID
jgi:hypothetical protein